MPSNSRFKQKLVNVTKADGYIFEKAQIRCMSSLEAKAVDIIKQLHRAKIVKQWASEETVFEYISPTDNKTHRYFMDFTLEMMNGDIYYIEVKDFNSTFPPQQPRKNSPNTVKNYQEAVRTWLVNSAKWDAVEAYCEKMNAKGGKQYHFVKWTERKELK